MDWWNFSEYINWWNNLINKTNEYWDRSVISDLSTNKHALLSNIELRTMNEESNFDAWMRIIESEVEL